jgi:hypothetical protein
LIDLVQYLLCCYNSNRSNIKRFVNTKSSVELEDAKHQTCLLNSIFLRAKARFLSLNMFHDPSTDNPLPCTGWLTKEAIQTVPKPQQNSPSQQGSLWFVLAFVERMSPWPFSLRKQSRLTLSKLQSHWQYNTCIPVHKSAAP